MVTQNRVIGLGGPKPPPIAAANMIDDRPIKGYGDPNGQFPGQIGREYFDRSTGRAWTKKSGEETATGWVIDSGDSVEANRDGVTDDSVLIQEALSDGATITLTPGIYYIAKNLTIPASNTVIFQRGAKLKPESGTKIILNCEVVAGRWEIFDYSAGGKVCLGFSSKTPALFPEWYGAVSDNSTNNSAAFDRLLDPSFTSVENTQRILLNHGYYNLVTGITVRSHTVMVGSGMGGTRLQFTPTTSGRMITLPENGDSIMFEDIEFNCTTTTIGIRTIAIGHADSSHILSGMTIHRCTFQQFNQYALYLGGTAYLQISDQTNFYTISNHSSIGGTGDSPAVCIFAASFFNQNVIGPSVKVFRSDQFLHAPDCNGVLVNGSSFEQTDDTYDSVVLTDDYIHLEGRALRVTNCYFEGVRSATNKALIGIDNAFGYDISSHTITGLRPAEPSEDTPHAEIYIRVGPGGLTGMISNNYMTGFPIHGLINSSGVGNNPPPLSLNNVWLDNQGGEVSIDDASPGFSRLTNEYRTSRLWHILLPFHHRTSDTASSSLSTNFKISHLLNSGGASAGMGAGIEFTATNGTADTEKTAGTLGFTWTTPTNSAEVSAFTIKSMVAGTLGSSIQADGNNTTGNTRFLLYDVTSGALQRVVVGANDSGGSGYRMLRIANA